MNQTYQCDLADFYLSSGDVAYFNGYVREAEKIYKIAIRMTEAAFGSRSPRTARALVGLADLYSSQRRYSEARFLYLRALIIFETALGRNNLCVAITLRHLSEVTAAMGSTATAGRMRDEATSILRQVVPKLVGPEGAGS